MSWIDRVMKENKYSYEVIMIDDGSMARLWAKWIPWKSFPFS